MMGEKRGASSSVARSPASDLVRMREFGKSRNAPP
jgi:hypothetical protein